MARDTLVITVECHGQSETRETTRQFIQETVAMNGQVLHGVAFDGR